MCNQGKVSNELPACEGTGTLGSGYCVPYRLRIPTGVDKKAANRDLHGRLENNSDPAFTFEVLIEEGSDACRSLGRYGSFSALEHELLCSPVTCAWNITLAEADESICQYCLLQYSNVTKSACLLKKNANADEIEEHQIKGPECQRKCQLEESDAYYNAITRGVELVFGDKPSVGFICSIKEAVIKDGKSLPGSCCLDAPFQLDGSNWGNAVSVEIGSDSQRSYDD